MERVLKDSLFVCIKKSLKLALMVGTILSAINQGNAMLSLSFGLSDAIRVGLNYLVPLFVASYSRFTLLSEIAQPKP